MGTSGGMGGGAWQTSRNREGVQRGVGFGVVGAARAAGDEGLSSKSSLWEGRQEGGGGGTSSPHPVAGLRRLSTSQWDSLMMHSGTVPIPPPASRPCMPRSSGSSWRAAPALDLNQPQ
jgi:hypothetical protein